MLKRSFALAAAFVIPLIAQLAAVLLLAQPVPAAAADFCWKGSYGRGVGTIPPGCTDGRQKEVGMCYTPCRDGYEGAVTMCLRKCPSGYVNTGLTCHIDKALLVPATVDACNLSTSCPSGYTNAGLLCGLNTPGVPAGYKAAVVGPAGSGLDLSREIYDRGIGLAPSACEPGKENNAGLCYSRCNPGYGGAGPVCWGQCPAGWHECAMGCARTAKDCGAATTSMVTGVANALGETSALIASFGTSTAATAPTKAGRIAQMQAKLAKMKAAYDASIKPYVQYADKAYDITKGFDKAQASATEEELAAAILQMAGVFDPTGWVSVAAAYTHPTCDKIKN